MYQRKKRVGCGRRRVGRPRVRRKVHHRGRGILSEIHNFVKDRKIVSRSLHHFGLKKARNVVARLGYGRRRPVRRTPVRHHRGRGFFGDLWSGIKSGVNWLRDKKPISRIAGLIPHPTAQKVAGIAGELGFGRRRRMRGRGGMGGYQFPTMYTGGYPYRVLATEKRGITSIH
jgi:hypothetical protein